MGTKPRLVILISGSGSNLQAIIDATAAGELDVEIIAVVSNRKVAYGLVRAEMAGIPTHYAPYKPYREAGKTRTEYDTDLAAHIATYQPDLLVLAGWMHIFTAEFLAQFPNKVINLHPALPDTFIGTHCIEKAFAAYERGEISESGCMVHYVIPAVDKGPVITTAVVPFTTGDTLETYETRIHEAEHRIIVEGTRIALGLA